MLRRRIFAYVIFFICGIAASYFIFEESRIFLGSLFIVCIVIILHKIKVDDNFINVNNEKFLLFMFLILGFFIFLFKFIQMNVAIKDDSGTISDISTITYIEGQVVRINEIDDGYKIVIRPTSLSGVKRIQMSVYQDIGNLYDCDAEIDNVAADLNNENDDVSDTNSSIDSVDYTNYLGRNIAVYGELRNPQSAENPGCFNYRLYLYGKNIRYTMSVKYLKHLADGEDTNIYWHIRQEVIKARNKFLATFSEEEAAIIKGIIFGDKSEIDEATIEEFNQNSTGHILAVSGLHVGFLFSLLKILTNKKKTKKTSIIIISLILLYGEMTGWNASTIRAIIVASLSLLHTHALRPFDLLSSVSASAFIILAINPYQLFASGFQLSFIALLSICFLAKPMAYFVGDSLSAILAVQIGIAPLLVYYFNGFNVLSILINIPIVFLASILVPICIIALLVMLLYENIPGVLIKIIEGLTDLIVSTNKLANLDGLFYNDAKGFSIAILVLFYLVVFYLASEWLRIKLIRKEKQVILRDLSLLVIPVICIGLITYNPFSNDEIVFISVGQGDCTHIVDESNNILIDGGGNENYNIGKKILKPYLLKSGAKQLDIGLLTHLHQDHYLGLMELNEVYTIGKIGIPIAYSGNSELPQNTVNIRAGDRIKVSKSTYIEAIWPIKNNLKAEVEDANEINTVYLIYYGKYKIMVTGDLIEDEEKKMVEYYEGSDKLKCDVLKVAHHGSKTSSSELFLDAVNPDIAVIQVGLNNVYGHPSQQTLERLKERGIKVYRTDQNGAVGLDLRKDSIHVDTMM